jgi:hypothetical protein
MIYLYCRYYSFFGRNNGKRIIFRVDGRLHHGGLADRFAGIITAYALSKIYNVEFKLDYRYPFYLTDFLSPNTYNWIISDDEISYNLFFVDVAVRLGDLQYYKYLKIKKETHLYANFKILNDINVWFGTNYTYKQLFEELFSVNFQLKLKISLIRKEIEGQYIGVVFRFQQLLGDLKEGNYPILDDVEQSVLIKKCKAAISQIMNIHKGDSVLVTSDSRKFLDTLIGIEKVYTIPGRIVHMDFTKDAENGIYEKSFIDFFVLGESMKIYNIIGEGLIKSGFPMISAWVHDKPFERIDINLLLRNTK